MTDSTSEENADEKVVIQLGDVMGSQLTAGDWSHLDQVTFTEPVEPDGTPKLGRAFSPAGSECMQAATLVHVLEEAGVPFKKVRDTWHGSPYTQAIVVEGEEAIAKLKELSAQQAAAMEGAVEVEHQGRIVSDGQAEYMAM